MGLKILRDTRFTVCSLAAQGLYVRVHELATLMEAPGYLRIAGVPLTLDGICSRICVSTSEATPLFGELEACKLLIRVDGALFAPDAEHTARIREVNRANGSRGGRPKRKRRSKTEPQSETVTETVSEPESERRGGTELTRWWDAEFERTRGVRFDWVRTGKRGCPDAIALAKLQGQFPIDEIKVRITRFLESPNEWDARNATPRIFGTKYAALAVEIIPLSKAQRKSLPSPQADALADLYRNV